MPNKEGHDQRELWEKTRDLQIELVKRADEITALKNRVSELENEKEALVLALTLTQPNENKEGD